MARKLSASSQRGKQIHVGAESIWSKPLTKRQKASLDDAAGRQKCADVSRIDCSDTPALTDKQLTQMRRPPRKLVVARLEEGKLLPRSSRRVTGTVAGTKGRQAAGSPDRENTYDVLFD